MSCSRLIFRLLLVWILSFGWAVSFAAGFRFDEAGSPGPGWAVEGDVAVVRAGAFDGAGSPRLFRTLETPVQRINRDYQFNPARVKTADWKGPEDLSGELRFLWNEQHLSLGVTVTDDPAGGRKEDGSIWAQDGPQFLVDPMRESEQKPGKYDCAAAIGTQGPQAWSYLTADPVAAPTGEARDIRVSTKRDDASGLVTYEVAIPWARLAPFRPAPGANLGLTLMLNEDDGAGRTTS